MEQKLSPTLVFGMAGRIGSGTSFVAEQLRHTLYSYEYNVEVIDISVLILLLDYLINDSGHNGHNDKSPYNNLTDILKNKFENDYPNPVNRTEKLQALGNNLRKISGNNNILTSSATSEFILPILKRDNGHQRRIAFILDSLKHPTEVHFLRDTFGDAFYMIGVTSNDQRRMERLRERKGYDANTFERISEIDADESVKYGQKTLDTMLLSDYVVLNEFSTKDEIRVETERFVSLIFGSTIISPRRDEFAMSVAYKSAARSACLSRKVGAAILNANGQLISTGYNDVPQFGGGVYDTSSEEDMRCWARAGKCYNDNEKSQIATQLRDELMKRGLLRNDSDETEKEVFDVIYSSRLKQITEFSRAVHAEMDAIINIARNGIAGIVGSTLYCTTYPCHNCAKHIIDAGISRVVYFEPYEKSLAVKFHSDAINNFSEKRRKNKVDFEGYGGVAPSRYDDFFNPNQERKRGGKYVDYGRHRQTLIPIGAPFASVLLDRIKRVDELLDNQVFNKKERNENEI